MMQREKRLKIEIVPAMDILKGKCVRLSQGDYGSSRVYSDDPVETAIMFESAGCRRLHLVDLDGAKGQNPVNLPVLKKIASATRLKVEFGGGIKSRESLVSVFESGAERAVCGSIAVCKPDLFKHWLEEFGNDKLVLGADVRNGNIAIKGWTEEKSLTVEALINQFLPYGIRKVVCTDISRDGMLCSPSVEFYKSLQEMLPTLEITVSGGISSMSDIDRLDDAGLKSVIVGKALYEGEITLNEMKQCLQKE